MSSVLLLHSYLPLLASTDADDVDLVSRLTKLLFFVIFVTFIAGMVCYRLYRRQRLHMVNNLRQMEQDHVAEVRQKDEEMRRIVGTCQESGDNDKWDSEQHLLNHDIVARLHQHAAHLSVPTAAEWNALLNTTRMLLPAFYEQLLAGNLTDREQKAAILSRLYFQPSETALLLDISKQQMANMRRSANNKLFHKDSSRGFDTLIQHM